MHKRERLAQRASLAIATLVSPISTTKGLRRAFLDMYLLFIENQHFPIFSKTCFYCLDLTHQISPLHFLQFIPAKHLECSKRAIQVEDKVKFCGLL